MSDIFYYLSCMHQRDPWLRILPILKKIGKNINKMYSVEEDRGLAQHEIG